MAEYDLTPKIIQYVDPHMAYWALCQLDDTPLYDERDLDDAKLTLLQKTKWVSTANHRACIIRHENEGGTKHGGLSVELGSYPLQVDEEIKLLKDMYGDGFQIPDGTLNIIIEASCNDFDSPY